MIVADTNFVIYFLIPGQYTEEAQVMRARDRSWIAPALFRHEFLSALIHYMRSKRLTRDNAIRLYRRALTLVKISDVEPEPITIFNLSMNSPCSSYDLEFVALAIKSGITLVTADQQLIREFPTNTTDLAQLKAIR